MSASAARGPRKTLSQNGADICAATVLLMAKTENIPDFRNGFGELLMYVQKLSSDNFKGQKGQF